MTLSTKFQRSYMDKFAQHVVKLWPVTNPLHADHCLEAAHSHTAVKSKPAWSKPPEWGRSCSFGSAYLGILSHSKQIAKWNCVEPMTLHQRAATCETSDFHCGRCHNRAAALRAQAYTLDFRWGGQSTKSTLAEERQSQSKQDSLMLEYGRYCKMPHRLPCDNVTCALHEVSGNLLHLAQRY